ncbi:thioredoxin family protein [Dyadobacter sp. LHD-138]|uniref:thioredoxin family protein n=1 Tax=Dyadobacter sp. LHD-138 TaxID=3071413 RepID=UPI0027DF9D8A|nr:thioredoxin family protein [Dyadobacter sp. LHD-138]MDQ6478265.1 thioredoxin family protein [Dyadobacter sp. LHD-138]
MKLFLWISLIALSGVASAAKNDYNDITKNTTEVLQSSGYQVGDGVANFKLKNIDGRIISLADFSSSRGVIVVFTSNHCPFAKAYEDRVIALNNKYASQGFPVIAINPSDPGTHMDDSFEKMKERASSKGYNYPYLVDEMQTVARAFGAARTPQVYVVSRSNGRFVVQYIGMIDDNPQDPAGATKFYVEEAVGNLIGGKPVVTMSTKPIGCAIKWRN